MGSARTCKCKNEKVCRRHTGEELISFRLPGEVQAALGPTDPRISILVPNAL